MPESQFSASREAADAALARQSVLQSGVSVPQTGQECPPINNMGENYEGEHIRVGRRILTTLCKAKAHKNLAFFDWLSVTVHETSFHRTGSGSLISTDEFIFEASRVCESIFGFGVTDHRQKVMNFYNDSWELGEGFGFICFGGQRETLQIVVSGLGCMNAAQGWEKRFYDFLTKTAIRPVITRCDLAHDDMQGAYLSVDWAEKRWAERGFNSTKGGRLVNIERVGNWHAPTGAGRTLTVGTRKAGKFCRFYEKGKQLGDESSLWCRAEVEFKSCDRLIPFDILLEPSAYFAGAYPCFSEFFYHASAQKVELKKRTAEITIESATAVLKHQFGKYISFFRQFYGDADLLERASSDNRDAVPKRMQPVLAGMGKAKQYFHEIFIPKIINIEKDFVPVIDVRRASNNVKAYFAASRG
ncbi:replication initiation factor domain-containing protein [Undibacterium oligocarboniphilum]|uniref:Replication initiation factor domain-containing protein n=1 Tax=Undibacterium oligocarboniphilum TaxID=666702 RepID=A0A850QT04_9BURK|nr:replication initiation factor domain-containing protein [Undibacterium oligocarboniphilum]MBC3871922.1 replication initiation factor domain-containing protein [Undibacterium oligocarboniphilum]NVO79494.1 replication initiation factor domain-containing protein [Undibacterium oligocarboniphilum]